MSTQNENAGSKSLMKKTKVELVDIILRKDDVEKQLRKEKADIELDFNKAKEMISKRDTTIDNLKKDIKGTEDALLKEQKNNAGLESCIDDLTTKNTALTTRCKNQVWIILGEAVAIIGFCVYCFCF